MNTVDTKTSSIEAFTIDDDFNPLQDLSLDNALEQETDYMMPIPDAELSRMPVVVPQTDEERIDHLIEGIPGAQFRLLRPVSFCNEPRTATEIIADLDASFPQGASVYGAAQIIKLLEEAGALMRINGANDELADDSTSTAASEPADAQAAHSEDYRTVSPAPASIYASTEAGETAVEKYCGEHLGYDVLSEEPRYLPIYKTILEMTASDAGCATKELDAVVDVDPLCEQPRRFCGYFLGRLEKSGALRWGNSWSATELGKKMLASLSLSNAGAGAALEATATATSPSL